MILETGPSAVTFLCYFSLFYFFTLLSFLVCVLFWGRGGVGRGGFEHVFCYTWSGLEF